MYKRLFKLVVPPFVLNYRKRFVEKRLLKKWEQNNFPIPPPHIVKQNIIKEYQQKSGYAILIETGTFHGDMVEAQKNRFKRIISIELGKELFLKAKKRFQKNSHITIIHGDSGKILPTVLNDINEPAIFWLDGHYSHGETALGEKESPIFEELSAIFNFGNFNPIILIDDARDFTGENGYLTIRELIDFIKKKNNKYHIEIKHDVIRCVT